MHTFCHGSLKTKIWKKTFNLLLATIVLIFSQVVMVPHGLKNFSSQSFAIFGPFWPFVKSKCDFLSWKKARFGLILGVLVNFAPSSSCIPLANHIFLESRHEMPPETTIKTGKSLNPTQFQNFVTPLSRKLTGTLKPNVTRHVSSTKIPKSIFFFH